MFQVRTEESKAFEQGVFRMTGRRGELRQPAVTLQCARSVDAESSCITSGGANGCEGELFCHRAPSLCPPAHHSPSRARRVCQELRWQGTTARFRLELREEAARPRGQAAAARLAPLRCAGLRSRPGRVVAREPARPLWCMERLMAALHAPFLPRAQPTRTAPWHPRLRWARGRSGLSLACMRGQYDAKL